MGFTSHGGDPQWLRDQRDAAHRASTPPKRAAMPGMPKGQRVGNISEPSTTQFVQGAKNNTAAAFVLGLVVGAVARGRR